MIRFILLIFFMSGLVSHGLTQAGHLGSLNSLKVVIDLHPTRLRTNVIKTAGTDTMYFKRLRFANPTYCFDYNRVITRKIEISGGMRYSKMRSVQTRQLPIEGKYPLLEDLILNQMAFNFEFKKYIFRSIAPIGKYVGFSFYTSKTKLNEDQQLIYAEKSSPLKSSNFFSRKYMVDDIVYENIEAADQRATSGGVCFIAGRSWILGDHLLFNFGLSIPFMNFTSYRSSRSVGGVFDFLIKEDGIISADYLQDTVFETIRSYNQIRLQLGVKYCF